MVKIRSTWVGRASGKLGMGIYYVRLGEVLGRDYVAEINDLNSEAQQYQRQGFIVSMAFSKILQSVFQTYFETSKPGETRFNAGMGYTLKNALTGSPGSKTVSVPLIKCANGPLFLPTDLACTNPSGQTIIITWVDNSGNGNALPDDTLIYMYFNITTNQYICMKTTQKRSDQSYSYAAPAGWSGNDVAVFVWFKSDLNGKYSISEYVDTLTLH